MASIRSGTTWMAAQLDAELVEPARQERTVLVLHLGGQHLAADDHHRGRGAGAHDGRRLHRARHLLGDPVHRLLPAEDGDPLAGSTRRASARP